MDQTNYVQAVDLVATAEPSYTLTSSSCGCKSKEIEDSPREEFNYLTLEVALPVVGKEDYDFLPLLLKIKGLLADYPVTINSLNFRKTRW